MAKRQEKTTMRGGDASQLACPRWRVAPVFFNQATEDVTVHEPSSVYPHCPGLDSFSFCTLQATQARALGLSSGIINKGNTIEVIDTGTDIQAIIDGITADADNPHVVVLGAGVFDLGTDGLALKEFVSLKGAGPDVTTITSSAGAANQSPAAATLDLSDNSRVADLTVLNTGTDTYGIAIYSALSTRFSVVDNVVAEANGDGGVGHFAAYWNDAEAIIRNSTLQAGGASLVNAAFGSVNISDGFPQALIQSSRLIGGANNTEESCVDSTATGYGMFLSNSSPFVSDSYICGGYRGISVATNGNPQVTTSQVKVSSTFESYLFEINAGSVSVSNSGVLYIDSASTGKITGSGGNLRCVDTYMIGFLTPLSDGTTSATACD